MREPAALSILEDYAPLACSGNSQQIIGVELRQPNESELRTAGPGIRGQAKNVVKAVRAGCNPHPAACRNDAEEIIEGLST
jgi:hypothetical protein